MRSPFFRHFSIVCFCITLIYSTPAFAVWAKHEIVQHGHDQDVYPITVRRSPEDGGLVEIFIPAEKPGKRKMTKGYFLITATQRLPKESLQFRSEMIVWPSHRENRERMEQFPELKEKLNFPGERLGVIEDIVPQDVKEHGERIGVRIVIPREQAMRSYIVYDFKPWGGGMVADGGLWLTYDLPTFVEKLPPEPGETKTP